MGYFSSLDVTASALSAESLRMDTIAQNIANSQTTKTANGQPYRRKIVLFEERRSDLGFSNALDNAMGNSSAGNGVRVSKIVEDNSPLRKIHDPGHPDADKDGFVSYPNVEPIIEMMNLLNAKQAYDANVTVNNSIKSMAMKALEIGK